MDIATILGILSGVGLVIWSITQNSGLDIFINIPSAAIVVGGTFAATFVAYPMTDVLKVFGMVQKIFLFKAPDPKKLIATMVQLAELAKREGILAIEKEIKTIKDDFVKKGLEMIVDGVDERTIDNLMQIEIVNTVQRHKVGWEIFGEMGKYAPAFGMVGTLIGLVQMLANLNDPSSIGPKMAVALITTFYGSITANLFFVPMSVKLKRRSHQESVIMNLVIEALKSIRQGENPRLMESKLKKFLSKEEEKKLEKSSGKKAAPKKK
ncbi:MAG: motility protein A [Candidatus Neomarinimicrobiota bacterium]|nr:MAG: motility protein A [Candidatus Neomarinimicrobiota bacterium]